MAYLYKEVPRGRAVTLSRHLEQCHACRQKVQIWQSSMGGLTSWPYKQSASRRSRALAAPALKWALAASLLLGVGLGIGRASAPRPDVEALRGAIEQPLRISLAADIEQRVQSQLAADWSAVLSHEPKLLQTERQRRLRRDLEQWTARHVAVSTEENQRLLADFVETYKANRQQDQATLLEVINRFAQRYQVETVGLRRALETIAVVADNKFQQAESELVQLASYARAGLSGETTSPRTEQ